MCVWLGQWENEMLNLKANWPPHSGHGSNAPNAITSLTLSSSWLTDRTLHHITYMHSSPSNNDASLTLYNSWTYDTCVSYIIHAFMLCSACISHLARLKVKLTAVADNQAFLVAEPWMWMRRYLPSHCRYHSLPITCAITVWLRAAHLPLKHNFSSQTLLGHENPLKCIYWV